VREAIKAFPGFADPAKMEKVDCSTAKYGDVGCFESIVK
jgi:hypothetical protein